MLGICDVPLILDTLPNPSKKFREWVDEILIREPENLELVLSGIIEAGEAATSIEALVYLNGVVRKYSFDGLNLTGSDLRLSVQKHNPFRELEGHIEKRREKKPRLFSSRLYGTQGHLAISKLFSGKLMSRGARSGQLTLFGEKAHSIRELGKTIKRSWEELADAMQHEKGYEWFYAKKKVRERLYRCLEKIFGIHFYYILGGNFFTNEYLTFLTLMSWASATLYYVETGRQILSSEVSVLAPRHGMVGGQIDGLWVTDLDGKPLSKREMKKILKMDFRSVDEFLLNLGLLAKNPVLVTILDWKFAVDDGKGGMRSSILQGTIPLPEHERQIERYLTLARYGSSYSKRDRQLSQHIALQGKLVYILPDRLPASYVVTLDDDKVKMLLGKIGSWQEARKESRFREVTHLVINHTIGLLKGNEGSHASQRLVNQGLLFPGDILRHPLQENEEDIR